jgi:hypothetical protein
VVAVAVVAVARVDAFLIGSAVPAKIVVAGHANNTPLSVVLNPSDEQCLRGAGGRRHPPVRSFSSQDPIALF